jgi:two-component system NtrC family sensor kinase
MKTEKTCSDTAAEARCRATLASIGEGVISTDAQGRIDFMNPVAERLTGWNEAAAKGRPTAEVFKIIDEKTRAQVESPVARVLREGAVVRFAKDTVLVAKDGTERPIADNCAPIRDQTGEITGVVLVFRDQTEERAAQCALSESERKSREIVRRLDEGYYTCAGNPVRVEGTLTDVTDRTRVEEALRQSEEKYRSLFDNAEAALYRSRIDGSGFIALNQRYADLVGFSKEELMSSPTTLRWAQPIVREEMLRLLRERGELRDYETEIVTKGGEVRTVLASAKLCPRESYVEGSVVDITERKRAEQALGASEAQLSNALKMARAGSWEYDVASDTFTFNDNFYRIFRTTAKDVGGYSLSSAQYIHRFCHPDDAQRVGREIQASLHAAEPNLSGEVEHRILFADGEVGTIVVRFFIVKDLQGHAVKIYGVNQDITERKRSQEALDTSLRLVEGIINAIPVRVFWKDRNLAYQGCNAIFARDAGFSDPKDLTGKDDYQMGWHDQAESYRSDDLQVIESGISKLLIEESQTTPTGNNITLLTSKVPLRGSTGEITGILGTYLDITARTQAEKEMQESEARFRLLTESSPEAIIVESVGRVLYANPKAAALLGKRREDLIGREFINFIPPEYREEVSQRIQQQSTAGQSAAPMEWEWVRGDGSRVSVESTAIATRYADADAHLVFVHDVTERKLAETLSEQLRVSFEKGAVAQALTSLDGRFIRVNQAMGKMLAYPPSELEGRAFNDVAHPDDRAVGVEAIEALVGGKEVVRFEKRCVTRDGSTVFVDVNIAAVRDAAGQLQHFVGTYVDITPRKQMEDELKEREEKYRCLFDSSRDAIMMLAPASMTYTGGNAATLAMFRTKDVREFTSLGLGDLSPERQPDGRLSHVRDLSEQRQIEIELAHARKLEAVGQLAAGIAHEINTPTQYVGDGVHFLKEAFEGYQRLVSQYRQAVEALEAAGGSALTRGIRETEEEIDLPYLEANVPGSFESCQDGVLRISTIVRAMKAFSHPDQREKSLADLNQALQTTLAVARNEYKYVAEVVTEFGDMPAVLCHVGALNQVFLNLIVNAAHAIGDVVGQGGSKGTIRIKTLKEGDLVRIDIADTGSGIPEAIRQRIFEPFFTTKEVGRGTGQGLAIARSIVGHQAPRLLDLRERGGQRDHVHHPIADWARSRVAPKPELVNPLNSGKRQHDELAARLCRTGLPRNGILV